MSGPAPDVTIENHGGIWMFRPETEAGGIWLQENAAAEVWQWRAGGLAVEARYAEALVVAMRDGGLVVLDAPGGPSDPRIH